MFQHFGNRLKRDLKQLVDRRLDINALSSGSSIKASSSPKRETDGLNYIPTVIWR